MKTFYSDRVTVLYVAPGDSDSMVVYEVTYEDVCRENESVDFETWAWCPDQESADKIAKALRHIET